MIPLTDLADAFEQLAKLIRGQVPTPQTWPMATNATGVKIIKDGEGLRLTAYRDPAGAWTIGYGHTMNVSEGQTITESQADALLSQDMSVFENAVYSAVTALPTENQFSAMVSLAFNIGQGGFKGSTVLRKHNLGDTTGAADAFRLWVKAHVDGELVVLPGLQRLRELERALYLTPDQ